MTSARFASALIGAVSVLALVACGASPGPKAGGVVNQIEAPTGPLPEGVTPTVYRVSLKTNPSEDGYTGNVEIDVTLDAPHSRIWLHSVEQNITRAFARLPDGSEMPATFTGDQAAGGVGYLAFETPLPTGQATLVMDYSAPYNLALAGLYKVAQGDKDYLVTQMEDIDARRMVPSFDEPRFKTPWVMTVTAPTGLVVVANAVEREARDLGDGYTEHEFTPTRAIQSYLVALAVGPYDLVEGEPIAPGGGRPAPIPLRAFAAAGKGAQLVEALAITDDILLWQEDYFGQPYPYGKLDLIAAPDFAYGAMENAGAIVYRESRLLIDERTSFSQKRQAFSTHAHELAHQWFGNLVTPKWWNDIWLNEAFATWMANKTMHAVDPGGAWDLNPISGGLGAMGSDGLNSARAIRNPVLTNGDINDAFDGITYQKGGSVLNMFETYLGEEKFRDGIRVHMRRFSDGVADADDFLASLSEGSGDEAVAGSFRTFITQPGIPMLDVAVSCTGGEASLTVNQSRYAPLGSDIDTDAQTWQVPFTARMVAGGKSDTVQTMLTEKSATLALPACPEYLIPNAGGTGYWRFAMDEASAGKLAANYAALSAGEQMVFVDSLMAGFGAGSVSAEALLAGLEASANGSAIAAERPFGLLRSYHDRLDDGARAKLSQWIEATYAPLEARLEAKSDLTDRERLLKDSLTGLLVDAGDRPAARAALVTKARAYIGLGGKADPDAVPPGRLGSVMGIAVEDGGETFARAALAYALASQNQTERGTILRAVGAKSEPALAGELVSNATTLGISPSEAYGLLAGTFSNTAALDTVWTAFKANFDTIVAFLPEVRKQQVPGMAGSLCRASSDTDVKTFFESKAELIPGYERRLAQAIEQSALCAARQETLVPKLAAALTAG